MSGLSASVWLFGIAVIIFIFMGTLFVLWPLFRSNKNSDKGLDISRNDANISLYEERIDALALAVSLGEMTPEDAELQKQEAGRHLLADTEDESQASSDKPGGAWVYVLTSIFLPLFAIFIYLQGDGWRLLNADDKNTPWDFILHRAHERLRENPSDIETWVFLARSYRAIEDHQKSADTYRKLNDLNKPPNPDYLVEEGEMLALLSEGNLRGRPTELFSAALAVNSDHGRALWYSGLAAYQREENTAAIQYWQQLSRQKLPESFRKVLSRQLKQLGAEPLSEKASATPDIIKVKVAISPKLAKGLDPETAVFVYAKATDGPGRPLAAQRLSVKDLPAEVALTDAMRMGDSPALRNFEKWFVFARVSKNGNATAVSGDPIGKLELKKSEALDGLTLTIDSHWN